MKQYRIGFAVCGSFCTFAKAIAELEKLSLTGAELVPIMSRTACTTDTRFGDARQFVERIEKICGRKIIDSIESAEPIGPQKLLDLLIIAPCTGNTLAKLALGVTDTPVTMAAKAHLRNERPLLIALATNDGLGASAKNLGLLMNTRNVYFVPLGQDDSENKPNSLVAHFDKLVECAGAALEQRQLQPVIV